MKQLPAMVLCKRAKGQSLAAFAFRSRPRPTLIGGIPWPISDQHHAFVFPELEPGTYQLLICEGKLPYVALQMVKLSVKKARTRVRAMTALAAGGPVEITAPLAGATGLG